MTQSGAVEVRAEVAEEAIILVLGQQALQSCIFENPITFDRQGAASFKLFCEWDYTSHEVDHSPMFESNTGHF